MQTRASWVSIYLGVVVGLLGIAWYLTNEGLYGLTMFIALPLFTGALGALVSKATSPGQAAVAGSVAILIGSFVLLGVRIEGAICILMALPLTLTLGVIGALLASSSPEQGHRQGRGTRMLAVLPVVFGTLGFDISAKPDIFKIQTSIEIAAPPERIWKHVVRAEIATPPGEWYFNAGIGYPTSARLDGDGVGATRYCDFSTGSFVEPITTWDEPHLLRFDVTESPAPMREWSPYGDIQPKHLHGYFISRKGEFRLTPLPNGHTLLEGTSWYQHGLWPEEYWRIWSDAIIHRIHMRVLTNIKQSSESP